MRDQIPGRDAIRDMFLRQFAATDMECNGENNFGDGERMVLEWRDPSELRGCDSLA